MYQTQPSQDVHQTNHNNQNNLIRPNDDANGLTVTWDINAHVVQKPNIITRIKNRLGKGPMPENAENGYVKPILRNVSGIVRPGQMCAIMGASGSGKTTLLNILNFRNQGNLVVDADIRVNGQKMDSNEIVKKSAYVQQIDLFIGTLTVKEQLTFYAMLKLGKEYTTKQKHEKVNDLLMQLNLFKCKDSVIGSGMAKSISGGEKRRLAFGSEIVTNPGLLFCDEPTSGLDSFMAETVVELLLDLAHRKKTMVCIIHQPSSQIFDKFDTLCLLSEGRVAYMGPAKEAYNHFSKLGYRCPDTYNPADYYIQTLAIKATSREQSVKNSNTICDAYDQSEQGRSIKNEILQISSRPQSNSTSSDIQRAPLSTQLRWLWWRELINLKRNLNATVILALQDVFLGLIFGLTFLNTKLDETGVQSIKGVLFLLLMHLNFGYFFAVLNSLPKDLPVLYREGKSRLYSILMYFGAKQLADLPKYLLFPFMVYTVVFWMSNISRDASIYIQVGLIYLLETQCAISFAMFLSAITNNLDVANILAIPLLMPMLILSGLFVLNSSIPNYLIWIKYISWFYYTYESVSIKYWTSISTIPCNSKTNNACTPSGCFKDGEDVLTNLLKFDKSNLERNIGLMFLLIGVYRILTYVTLKIKVLRK